MSCDQVTQDLALLHFENFCSSSQALSPVIDHPHLKDFSLLPPVCPWSLMGLQEPPQPMPGTRPLDSPCSLCPRLGKPGALRLCLRFVQHLRALSSTWHSVGVQQYLSPAWLPLKPQNMISQVNTGYNHFLGPLAAFSMQRAFGSIDRKEGAAKFTSVGMPRT